MLDEFRSTSITWDKATRRIYSPITANASDSNGRKLNIQVVNSGQVENLTGATLHLYWETKDKLHDGLDAFTASDISKGEFELFYTTGMLSNVGELNATLVLVDGTGKVVSDWFKITVTRGINEGAIESENSFSSLTKALIDISNLEQNYTPRLNDLTAQLQQTEQNFNAQLAEIMTQEEFDSWVATILDGGPSIFFDTLTALQTAYPDGSAGVALVRETDPARIYVWNGSIWQDYGPYQGLEVKDGTITNEKLGGGIAKIAESLEISNSTPYAYSIEDSDGRVAFAIDNDGTSKLKQKTIDGKITSYKDDGTVFQQQETSDDYAYVFADENGKVALAIDDDGNVVVKSIKADIMEVKEIKDVVLEKNTMKHFEYGAEINMFITYGQSWAQGYDANVMSTEQQYDSLMLNTGVRNSDVADYSVTATNFVPLIEQMGIHTWSAELEQSLGETPTYSQTAIVKQLLHEENNINTHDVAYQLLGASPGVGSATIEMLSKGTAPYGRLINQVQKAYDISKAQNKTFKVSAFSWAQGSSATDDANYMVLLEQLRADIDSDVKNITGQAENVKCITWQAFPSGNGQTAKVYDRYVKASEVYPDIICSGPTYQLDWIQPGNNLHFSAKGSAWLGAYFGIAYKRSLLDGNKFEPLKPVKFDTSGNILLVKFNVPKPPLKFDITQVAENENYGFSLMSSTNVEKVISSVSIVGTDTIKIVSDTDILSTDRLLYADKGSLWGTQTGKRGNLRDSQGDTIRYSGGYETGLDLPMHNWCVVFDKTINEEM